jgi:hypothetical protein
MFSDSGLSARRYSDTLIGWANHNHIPSVMNLGIVPAGYCDTATTARALLVDTFGWTISDLGLVACETENPETDSSSSSTGTKVGIRGERIEALRSVIDTASTTSVTVTIATFIDTLQSVLTYLTDNEADIETLSPEEAKQVILALRDALLQILRLIPVI